MPRPSPKTAPPRPARARPVMRFTVHKLPAPRTTPWAAGLIALALSLAWLGALGLWRVLRF
ncbi:MAG: hypothetical protein PHX82_00530 [Paracoccaceae bacterium]|nr:hypothetical protein [Paracoccaceae bacterium]